MPPSLPNSTAQRDIETLIHPYTNLKVHQDTGPLVISRGEGVRVFGEDGTPYIEAMAGLWCTSLGWSEKRLVTAATEAMSRLPFYHSFTHKVPDVTVDLAERLLALAPVKMGKVFFANSGSEAVDTALKLVWYINNARGKPLKKKVIAREKAYHGVTIASASLTGLPACQNDFDLPIPGVLRTGCPHYYRFGQEGESEQEFATRRADELEQLILSEGPDTIAAMFAEPVMGAGGVIVPPATYFEKIQAVLKKYDILLIADEVICGFGRTGNMWGSQTYDLKPDMMTMAKALSSAYMPISALMVSDEIFADMVKQSEKLGVFGHGYTYGGHPVACAVALETLKIYEERDIVSTVQDISPAFQTGLAAFKSHPLVGEVRGVGLVAAVELVKNKTTRESFDPKLGVGMKCAKFLQNNGVIGRAMGDSLAFSPPLIISRDEIAEMLAGFAKALDQTLEWLQVEGHFAP
ncbi:aspartate aminotransferase family protein [Magnetovibrio blakemorei]|uniref:Aminotransferase n=1 Tax=Magnetovibrio blakemorei TaxID=28181 RepID=A0A1E5QAM0_9PROT|nr:aspartate aminotransferase family protein [Magnetovibrio blakemorei]OEJ68905.1 aminotransferase [Magnetovibrio blakemorei]